jgi:NAD(P) transhydrogenase subunit alpha
MTPETLIASITLFVLSIFLGFELITKVPATLHTAVSGILAFVALTLAMINVVGGFAVTNRMLSMIAGKKRGGA